MVTTILIVMIATIATYVIVDTIRYSLARHNRNRSIKIANEMFDAFMKDVERTIKGDGTVELKQKKDKGGTRKSN